MAGIYDMIVIGGGPGGYTAAMYAARAGHSVVVVEKLSAGGQMALTTQIENYPGFDDGIDGFELGERMQRQAERFGARTELAEVTGVRLEDSIKIVETTEGTFQGKTVVFSTGANPRTLGIPGEAEFSGRGIHYCSACDGMMYRGKTVVVVGGGNSAAAEALHLSRLAKKVIVIHRRDTLRATKIYHEPLMNMPNVEFRWNSAVSALVHDGILTGVKVKAVRNGEESIVPCDGVFVSIGRMPASGLAQGQLAMDEAGYLIADESTRASVPGVFAVGDVRTKALRQVITAASDGAMAAHYAEEYLTERKDPLG